MEKNKKNININDNSNLDNNNETSAINLDQLQTTNIGMKEVDPSTHSNIAQISDTDEIEQRKIQFEKLEKRRKLGLRKPSNDDDDIMLDDAIISKELILDTPFKSSFISSSK